MTNTQSDRLDMYKAVVDFLETTNTITATRPGLVTGKTQLTGFITDIETKAGKQTTATSGSFDEKEDLIEKLCQELYTVVSGTKAYAASIPDTTLKGKMDYSLTELRRLGDETIVPFTDNIVEIVTPLLGAPLAGFGVDAAAMTELDKARDKYENIKSKPRVAVSEKAAQTTGLPPLFVSATKLCKEILDPTAATLRATEPDWYNEFVNVRKIVNTGSGTTALDGDIKEQGSNGAIYNVEITISKIGEPDIKITSDVAGHYKQIPIKRGVYTVTFTHALYKDVVLNAFEIKQGQTVTKNILMEKKV